LAVAKKKKIHAMKNNPAHRIIIITTIINMHRPPPSTIANTVLKKHLKRFTSCYVPG
jgi:hypothetical protein